MPSKPSKTNLSFKNFISILFVNSNINTKFIKKLCFFVNIEQTKRNDSYSISKSILSCIILIKYKIFECHSKQLFLSYLIHSRKLFINRICKKPNILINGIFGSLLNINYLCRSLDKYSNAISFFKNTKIAP